MNVTISIFENLKQNPGVRETHDFESFLDDFKNPVVETEREPSALNVKALKRESYAFSPATFTGDYRNKDNIESAQLLAFDLDEGVDEHELSARLKRRGIAYAIHSTISSGLELAKTGLSRVHVLIPLAKPVDADTYLRFWDEAKGYFHGYKVDMSKRGAESLFFVPKIFAAHRPTYYFDSDTSAPCLGASGFKPLGGPEWYLNDVRTCQDKHTAINRAGFWLGKLGWDQATTREMVLAALRENKVSTKEVQDWQAAENTIVNAWEDGSKQKVRPKHVVDAAKATAKRVLKKALAEVVAGEDLEACAFKVGQFVPHVLASEDVLNALTKAWSGLDNHEIKSHTQAQSIIADGLNRGANAPKGLQEDWQKTLKKTQDGLGFHTGDNNVYTVLREHPDLLGVMAFDVREGAPVYLNEPPWHEGRKLVYPCRITDDDKSDSAIWVRDVLKAPNVATHTALSALLDAANKTKHDALLDYYKSLTVDNNVDVLETILCKTLGAPDTEYTRTVIRKWLIGVVARQFRPGCKMDNVLITAGEQGLGKSTFFRELFPQELQQQVFTDSLNVLRVERDQVIKLSRFAVVELGELAAWNKADMETVKTTVTCQVGDERAAYARVNALYPRRAVFAGSTNKKEFLRDPTGNRRFWPVDVSTRLDLKLLRSLRDTLWAQAVSAYLREETWHLGLEEEALANEVRAEHEEEDVLIERLAEMLGEWPADPKYNTEPVFTTRTWQLEGRKVIRARTGQLLLRLGEDTGNKGAERRVGECMRRLGWISKTETHESRKCRVWVQKAKLAG